MKSENFKEFYKKMENNSLSDLLNDPEIGEKMREFNCINNRLNVVAPSVNSTKDNKVENPLTNEIEDEKIEEKKISDKDVEDIIKAAEEKMKLIDPATFKSDPFSRINMETLNRQAIKLQEKIEKAKNIDPTLKILEDDPLYKRMAESLGESAEFLKEEYNKTEKNFVDEINNFDRLKKEKK